MAILFFILVLTILVFVHELGHFIAARKNKVAVEEFGIGFPPRAIGVKRGSTTYSLNWVPLGGFVKIKGEQGEHEDDPDSFAHKPAWRRAIILASGVLMNIALAWFLLTLGFAIGSPGIVAQAEPRAIISEQKLQVVEIEPLSPAEETGIAPGDTIISVGGSPVTTVQGFRDIVSPSSGTPLTLEFVSNGESQTVTVTPVDTDGKGIVGVGLIETGLVRYPFLSALWHGFRATWTFLWQIIVALYTVIHDLFVGQPVTLDLAGPVGIAVLTGEIAQLGVRYLLQFMALLSLNLAVINILPFPALDGGRLLFLLIEKVRRKPVSKKVEALTHNIGFALLILLVIVITIKDLSKLSGAVASFFSNIF